MSMLKRMSHLIEKQTQAFTEGLLKNIFKEIQDGKEEVSNRNDGSITVADDSSKQGGKLSAEEKFETMEMEKGMSEPCSLDKDTLLKKTYSTPKQQYTRTNQKIYGSAVKVIDLKELLGKKTVVILEPRRYICLKIHRFILRGKDYNCTFYAKGQLDRTQVNGNNKMQQASI
ncbi:uncharacterized protein LOC143835811 [Paroedura picta]|uniref:uncharacterized protein LOC143835811 n=1 Tax=Paroedura picta TaxID=143630 RepID=UPI00405769B3